jgi:hypothetical protein
VDCSASRAIFGGKCRGCSHQNNFVQNNFIQFSQGTNNRIKNICFSSSGPTIDMNGWRIFHGRDVHDSIVNGEL